MVQTMGLSHLQYVVYELLQALREGYQRHICNYTVRTVLTTVLAEYQVKQAES